MKNIIFILVVLSSLILADPCFSISIIAPKDGAIYYPGDKVIVKVMPDPGENIGIKGIFIFAGKSSHSTIDIIPPYKLEFVIDPDFLGKDSIVASAKLEDGSINESRIEIEVVLPPSVKIDNLIVEPDIIFVTKVPPGTEGVRFYETESLRVQGKYSDGIIRELTSSSFGTTYTSSNIEIISVDSEGLVTAQAPGQAKIVISNGDKRVVVDVYVKLKE